jgi:hypothetical protein
MSGGDFAEELRQSVADQLSLIASAARAAKARIGQGVSDAAGPPPPMPASPPPAFSTDIPEPDYAPRTTGPAVDFFADEPVHDDHASESDDPLFSSAMSGGNGVPEGAISYDDYAEPGIDDEGIPVWEDPP